LEEEKEVNVTTRAEVNLEMPPLSYRERTQYPVLGDGFDSRSGTRRTLDPIDPLLLTPEQRHAIVG
ncbi:MAG: hypothetical protein ACK56F_14835, partial [bacterium]